MRPRFDTTQHFRYRHSSTIGTPVSPPRESARHDSPFFADHHPNQQAPIATAELNGFALSCIEKLAFPGETSKEARISVEDTIASVVMDKLPSYTTLKTSLKVATQTHPDSHAWSSTLQTDIAQLRTQVETMQETIAAHLIQTGEEIGLPTPLLEKLADLTKAILTRYAA